MYIYVIETKGRTLEETAALFDGVDATELVTGAGARQGEDEKSLGKGSASDVEHLESAELKA